MYMYIVLLLSLTGYFAISILLIFQYFFYHIIIINTNNHRLLGTTLEIDNLSTCVYNPFDVIKQPNIEHYSIGHYCSVPECEEFNYGPNCGRSCGHCRNDEPCDKRTGVCQNGCVAGWRGQHCNECMYLLIPVDYIIVRNKPDARTTA